jgi:hypothetical protein
LESSREALKVRRISVSDKAELRMKIVKVRERKNEYVQVSAIGGD